LSAVRAWAIFNFDEIPRASRPLRVLKLFTILLTIQQRLGNMKPVTGGFISNFRRIASLGIQKPGRGGGRWQQQKVLQTYSFHGQIKTAL